MPQPLRSASDPAPQKRRGDDAFLPVVIAFAVAIFVLLIAGIIFIKVRQQKAIPTPKQPHPTSQNTQPAIRPRPELPATVVLGPQDQTTLQELTNPSKP
jgi:cell division protein FtsN